MEAVLREKNCQLNEEDFEMEDYEIEDYEEDESYDDEMLPVVGLSLENSMIITEPVFEKMLEMCRDLLISSLRIERGMQQLGIKNFKELASVLIKPFNEYVVSNGLRPMSNLDVYMFVEETLQALSQSSQTESMELKDELSVMDSSANMDQVQMVMGDLIDEMVPMILNAMASHRRYQACQCTEQQIASALKSQFNVRQALDDMLEEEGVYHLDLEGNYVRNEKLQIWNKYQQICQDPQVEKNDLRELVYLMMESDLGYEAFYQDFLSDFKQQVKNQTLRLELRPHVQEVLCQLSYLKTEYEMVQAFNIY